MNDVVRHYWRVHSACHIVASAIDKCVEQNDKRNWGRAENDVGVNWVACRRLQQAVFAQRQHGITGPDLTASGSTGRRYRRTPA